MECVKLQGHQFPRQPIINDNNDDDNENDDAYDDAYANDDDDDDDNVNCSSIEECDDNQWQLMTLTNLNQKFYCLPAQESWLLYTDGIFGHDNPFHAP